MARSLKHHGALCWLESTLLSFFDGAKRYVSYSDEETKRLAASYCEQEVQTDMFTLCDVPRNKLIVQCYPQDMPKVEAHGKQYHNAQCVCFKQRQIYLNL